MLQLALITLLVSIVHVHGGCDEGFGYVELESRSTCYALEFLGSSPFQPPPTWAEAQDRCNRVNGTLATVDSLEIQMLLNAFMIQASQTSDGVWIGLNDADDDADFEWDDGTTFDGSSWTNWGPDQPIGPGTGARCVHVAVDDITPGSWEAVLCDSTNTKACFCQQDANDQEPTPISGCTGAEDFSNYFGYCFKVITDKLSFEDARTQCQSAASNADLASIRSGYHNDIIRLLMIEASELDTSWIGLQISNNEYQWTDKNNLWYADWGAMEPGLDSSLDSDGCVATDLDTGDWFDYDCSELKSAVCGIRTSTEMPPQPERGECPEGWNEEGFECFRYVDQNLTWADAGAECQSLYVDATISIPHGQSEFDWDRYNIDLPTEIWIGVSRNDEDKFETVDGSVLNYVNWAAGQPGAMADNEDCLMVTVTEQGEALWSGQNCDNGRKFFCAFPQITAPIETGECKSGWFKFDNKCYRHFNERLTFGDAVTSCRDKEIGGDLAAIHSDQMQALLTYLMGSWSDAGSAGDVWIGLWDTTDNQEFQWTNGDNTVFWNWAPGQPDGYLNLFDPEDKNDCVMMRADPVNPGLWDDVSCKENRLTYVCECYLDPMLPTPTPQTSVCEEDYLPASQACWGIVTTRKSFQQARQDCVSDGGDLASIDSGYVQGLVKFLLTVSSDVTQAWIGISDENSTGEYKWTDGSPVNYVDWDRNSPIQGQCVAFRRSGKWLEHECNVPMPSICKNAQYVPVTPNTEAWHCDDGWLEFAPTRSCYLIDTYTLQNEASNMYITYADAKRMCGNLGGTLASLHSVEENQWFYGQARITLGKRKIWLGMHRTPENMMRWDDGSVLNYVNWAPGEPDGILDGANCFTFYAGDEGLGLWSDTDCFELNAYACKKEPLPGPQPICDPDWLQNPFMSQFCYFLRRPDDEDGPRSWDEAEAFCKQMGSHLAKLESWSEANFVISQLQNEFEDNPESWPWIGLRRYPGNTDFVWTDGTVRQYNGWTPGQPDSDDDDCAAIELQGSYGWNDINCGLKRPFICQKSGFATVAPTTPVTTTDPPGDCVSGGGRIGDRCYKIEIELLNWDDARKACAELPNGDLASIPVYAVQALIASLLKLVDNEAVWLGLTSRMPYDDFVREYHWIDGSTLTFTNWGSGQPSLSPDEDHCVKMLTDPDAPGRWYDEMCDQQYPYICQYDLDPNATPAPVASLPPCPQGFTGSASTCFRIETTERPFSTAVEKCGNVDGILAPVMDGHEDALIELLLYDAGVESAWIGLRSNEVTEGKYKWTNERWPVTYTNWAEGEPTTEQGCVALVYSEGWKSVDCGGARASICRYDQDPPPPTMGGMPDDCPEHWYLSGQDCYLINTGFTSDNLLNAFFRCSSIYGLPPSVHSRKENLFVRNNVLNEVTGKYVWLGLVRDGGQYNWMDGSPIDYSNWEEGQDLLVNDGRDCVVMVPEREGKWNRMDCSERAEIVCKLYTPSIPSTVLTTTPVPTTTVRVTELPAGLSTGAIVGISIGGGVALLLLVICVCYYCEKSSQEKKEWMRAKEEMEHSNRGFEVRGDVVHISKDIELRKKAPDAESMESVSSDSDSHVYEMKF